MTEDGLRSRFRGAVRRLPPPVQLWMKRADAAVRQSDWAGPARALRVREQAFIDATVGEARRLSGRQRILLFTLQTPSPWSAIECSLAMALTLRGHVVRGVLCDGLLPVCEMNLGAQERPPCDTCVGWRLRYYEEAFGFEWPRLSDFLGDADREEVVEFVGKTPDAALPGMTIDGIEVGRHARRELQRYRRGFVLDPPADPMYRPWLVAGALLIRLAGRLLDRETPGIVVASSGRTLASACLGDAARSRDIRVVTWDTEPSHPDGLVFSHGRPAVELSLDEIWTDAAQRPLSVDERAALHAFLGRWAKSENTPFPYNPAPIDDQAAIRSRLRLRADRPVIAAFTNTAWDMAVVDRDVGFESMFDWVFTLVEYARTHPDVQLVVRAHPAEVTVPADLRSTTPVVAAIRARFTPLPGNVFLVEPDSALSSYSIARLAQVAIVYASRIGLELAIDGLRSWLAGDVNYRGKGFTRDLASKAEMIALLERRTFDERLSRDEIERAERFAYTWLFRHVARLPALRPAGGAFALDTFRTLAPGGDMAIDRVCEALASGAPFLDLSQGTGRWRGW